MRILILGGAGFVGRRFSRRLSNDGHQIWIVDNLISGLLPSTGRSRRRTGARFISSRPTAGIISRIARRQRVGPDHSLRGNRRRAFEHRSMIRLPSRPICRSTRKCFPGRCEQAMPKVIYFSSSAVYPLELQTRQSHCALAEPLVNFKANRISFPDRTYGWAKLSGEYLAQFAHDVYGLNVRRSIVRLAVTARTRISTTRFPPLSAACSTAKIRS